MDVQQRLDGIVAAVQGAKGMPMSASCVINRAGLLASLEEVRQALPGALAQAQEVLGDRAQMVAEAQEEARRIREAAHAERGSLVETTAVVQQAQAEAARLLAEARREAAEVRAEADDYVDSKLANFEVVLGKTIGSVDRGREKLLGPDRGDPQELLQRADAYVEAQFGAIEAVLRKTLEAVGRGRQKLTGHRPTDELAEHIAAQDAAGTAAGPGGQEAGSGGYYDQGAEQDTYQYLGMEQPRQPEHEPALPVAAVPYQAQQPSYAESYAQDGYQDPYTAQPDYTAGYAAGYPQDYGGQPARAGYGYPQQETYQSGGALDETSFFDTGMIDAEQLRRYEQGHGNP